MTRVHEEYSKTGDNDHSIRVGIKESGPVIVAAALIMFSVFIAFVFQDDSGIKSMGIALGFGVLFDAFVVRMTLIPALTKLFGKASWYLPKWLGAVLPNIDVEGKALEEDNHHDTSSEKVMSTIKIMNTLDKTKITMFIKMTNVTTIAIIMTKIITVLCI